MEGTTAKPICVWMNWLNRHHFAAVLKIERQAFEFPWREDDFVRCLRQRNRIGMVAETAPGDIVGFMVYELHKVRIHVLNFAVGNRFRRQGVGRQMVNRLVGKLSAQRRSIIRLEVRESNVPGLEFFKAMGFRAVELIRGFYDETSDDAIVMQYRLPMATAARRSNATD